MNPRRITRHDNLDEVRRILKDFYAHKPPQYDLINREQHEYDKYAGIISAYSGSKGRALDFGAGTWRGPKTIALEGFGEVVGCDFFSDQELDAAKGELNGTSARLVHYDGERLPFPDNHFDVVASLCVLEHVLDIQIILKELDRVLKPGGAFGIVGPNWSGLNNPIKGLYINIAKRQRYWRFENLVDALIGILRVFGWYVEVRITREPKFIMIHPRTTNGRMAFEASDDDCVHLCHPLSFRKWFSKHGYDMLQYNRGTGHSSLARWFNTVLPSLATTNVIVARKRW